MSAIGGKKKIVPKPRKRKISDVGATGTKAKLAPAKRLVTDVSAAISVTGSGVEASATPAAQLKPFVRGELVDSSRFLSKKTGT